MTRFLTKKEVIFINALVIKRYTPKEQAEVKDYSFGEEAYPTFWLKAAAFYASIHKITLFIMQINGLDFRL